MDKLSKRLRTTSPLKRLFLSAKLADAAAARIDDLTAQRSDYADRLAKQEQAHKIALIKAEQSGKDLYQRTLRAIAEMQTSKGNYKTETPVAVILSPSQFANLSFAHQRGPATLANLEIVVAKGVYGPVVLTQDGFNAFTRNAPELNIRSMRPTYG